MLQASSNVEATTAEFVLINLFGETITTYTATDVYVFFRHQKDQSVKGIKLCNGETNPL